MRTRKQYKQGTRTTKKKQQKTTEGGASFNYPQLSLALNNKLVSCHTCGGTIYYKLNVSVERSKTATLATDWLFGDAGQDIINAVSHPMRCYVCTQCITCKFLYAPTTWNQLTTPIQEIQPQIPVPPPQPAPAPAPAPPQSTTEAKPNP